MNDRVATELSEPFQADTASGYDGWIVRYGSMRIMGRFDCPDTVAIKRRSMLVVRTDRGIELAEAICEATPVAIDYIPELTRGEILRVMTPADKVRESQLKKQVAVEFIMAQRIVADHHLAMQIVDIERLFGGERLILYFLSEKRIDFRELVRSLAREFQTRIELRQIGVRDEAKLLADYGDCGKPVCCNTHMIVMPPVSMRMAKLQKATLDPSKISGRCGRLKCCLRFEQDVYEEFQKELPAIGKRVVTVNGPGRVIDQQILARNVLVEFEDGRRLPVPIADIVTVL